MSQSFQFRVAGEDAGKRLDEFLASRFAALTRMRIANLISAGACFVNQQAAQSGYRVAAGDLIEIAFEEGAPTAMQPEPIALEIIYEDDHLVVVNKPAGMLVHPTKGVKSGTLANALAYHLNKEFYGNPKSQKLMTDDQLLEPDHSNNRAAASALMVPAHGQAHSLVRPGLAHRLDRATSGLMAVAKTPHALSRLAAHFRRRLVEKRYLALVHGSFDEEAGSIIAPIGRDPDRRPRWWVMESGKEAETRYRVVERLRQATLVELEPVTGRTNQLRIHCAYSGHPIIGDEIYGAVGSRQKAVGSEGELSSVDQLIVAADRPENMGNLEPRSTAYCLLPTAYWHSRLCLHAWRLAFHHPASNEWMELSAPLPRDFASLLELLRACR